MSADLKKEKQDTELSKYEEHVRNKLAKSPLEKFLKIPIVVNPNVPEGTIILIDKHVEVCRISNISL